MSYFNYLLFITLMHIAQLHMYLSQLKSFSAAKFIKWQILMEMLQRYLLTLTAGTSSQSPSTKRRVYQQKYNRKWEKDPKLNEWRCLAVQIHVKPIVNSVKRN